MKRDVQGVVRCRVFQRHDHVPLNVERVTFVHDENQGGCSQFVWSGEFFLSSLSCQQMWTSKGEYDESRFSSSTVVFAHFRDEIDSVSKLL